MATVYFIRQENEYARTEEKLITCADYMFKSYPEGNLKA